MDTCCRVFKKKKQNEIMDFNTVSTLIISIAYIVASITFAVYTGLSLATNIVNIIRTQKKEQWLTFFGSISTPGSLFINALCLVIALCL